MLINKTFLLITHLPIYIIRYNKFLYFFTIHFNHPASCPLRLLRPFIYLDNKMGQKVPITKYWAPALLLRVKK